MGTLVRSQPDIDDPFLVGGNILLDMHLERINDVIVTDESFLDKYDMYNICDFSSSVLLSLRYANISKEFKESEIQ